MRHLASLLSSLALVTTIGACTSSNDGGLRPGDRGGKADGRGECASDQELIAEAREALVALEPEFYGETEWLDEIADVQPIEDLNGDGVDEALVLVGLPYAGANTEIVLFVSRQAHATADYACTTQFAGHFGGLGVVVTADETYTEGLRDIEVSNSSACEVETRRWKFDGTFYVETDDSRNENVCEEDPGAPEEP